MEESADFALNKNKFSLINNDQLNSIDVSNNDPIPSLFIPKNNITQEKNSIITQIIKDVTSDKKNTNLNQIKQKIQNKISIIIPLQNLQKHNSSPNEKNIMLINDLIESKETILELTQELNTTKEKSENKITSLETQIDDMEKKINHLELLSTIKNFKKK